jgi:hypothetical protein
LTILLGGGTKQRQQADIVRSKLMWAETNRQDAAGSEY